MSAATVRVTALLALRDELGFGDREVEFTGSSLRDLLLTVPTQDGGNLEQLLCDGDGRVRDCYVVLVNGSRVQEADVPLHAEDQVVTTQFFRAIAGG